LARRIAVPTMGAATREKPAGSPRLRGYILVRSSERSSQV
jgi:hypothetical protein